MPSTVSFNVSSASASRSGGDIIHHFLCRRRSSPDMADPGQEYLSVEEQIDAGVKSVVICLRGTRDAMTEMSRQHPIDICGLSDLVFEARKVNRNMVFAIRRHFDAKEEGMRVNRTRELSALEAQGHGLVTYLTKRATLAMKHFAERGLDIDTNRYNKRLQILEDAISKVEMHRTLVVLSEGSNAPY